MDLNLLNERFKNCSCRKTHVCPIDYINIGKGAINSLPQACENYHKILMVSDNNTYSVCGKDAAEILGKKSRIISCCSLMVMLLSPTKIR